MTLLFKLNIETHGYGCTVTSNGYFLFCGYICTSFLKSQTDMGSYVIPRNTRKVFVFQECKSHEELNFLHVTLKKKAKRSVFKNV